MKLSVMRPTRGFRTAERGFTLLELMLALAAVALLTAVAVPSYSAYVRRTQVSAAIGDIQRIQLSIEKYSLGHLDLPLTLADVGFDGLRDPWGNPYVYLNLAGANRGAMRKDRNLVPINSDYDLYSSGPDGRSAAPLTAAASRDDIVRANNGAFIGLAEKY